MRFAPPFAPTTAPFGNPCRSNAYAKYSWISRNPSSSSSSSVLSSSSRRPSPPFAASRKSRVAAFVRVAARTSKYRQYVVSTTSHADRSMTSRSSAIKSSSSAICFRRRRAIQHAVDVEQEHRSARCRHRIGVPRARRPRGTRPSRARRRDARARAVARGVAGAAASVARGRARMRRTRARGDE